MNENKEKTVYFVRHGQSEANISRVFQTPESPLTSTGKAQAEKIAERISKINFEKLVVSPFLRAKDTGEAIARLTGKTPEYNELFVERGKPTALHGKSFEDPSAEVLWKEWEKSLYTPGMKAEDGEGYDELMARADKAIHFLTELKEENIVVVTHGYFFRVLVAKVILGDTLTPEAFKNFHKNLFSMENTGLSVLKYTESWNGEWAWHVWIYNDHTHLG